MKRIKLYNPVFDNLYKDFFNYTKIKGYSPKQKEPSVGVPVREFLSFIEGKSIPSVKRITSNHILEYHEYIQQRPNMLLKRGGGLSPSMIRHHLYAVRLFFDYLLDTHEIESTPANFPKFMVVKYDPRPFATIEEIKELYTACENTRDRAIISLAYGCGLRRHELCNLNMRDVLLHRGIVIVRDGKGGKNRTVPISDTIIRELREYIINGRDSYLKHGDENNPAFILNLQGLRISGNSANLRFKELCELTKNPALIQKGLTLHCLRHSIATHLADKGASIEFLKDFLGHSSIDTSHIYAKHRKLKTRIIQSI